MADVGGGLMDLGNAAQLFGGAAGDLLSVPGYQAEGRAYGTAANAATGAAAAARKSATLQGTATQIDLAANAIQGVQAARQVYQVTGGARADVASANLTESGSAMDIIRSNEQQGSLQQQMIKTQGGTIAIQGQIQQNAYETQATGYDAQAASYVAQGEAAFGAADAAKAGAGMKTAGGILSIIGAITKFF